MSRVRRRADARAFDLACEAAVRHGARRLRAIAFERAIEGTVKRHYWHGELKSEERIYDNRLLVYLLGKTAHILDEPEEAKAVADHWEPWVEAIGEGAPAPDLTALEDGPDEADDMAETEPADVVFDGSEVWQIDGTWWTSFPPPEDCALIADGEPGAAGYRRQLTDEEEELIEADEARIHAGALAEEARRRNLYFAGIAELLAAAETPGDFPPKEAETYGTSGEAAHE